MLISETLFKAFLRDMSRFSSKLTSKYSEIPDFRLFLVHYIKFINYIDNVSFKSIRGQFITLQDLLNFNEYTNIIHSTNEVAKILNVAKIKSTTLELFNKVIKSINFNVDINDDMASTYFITGMAFTLDIYITTLIALIAQITPDILDDNPRLMSLASELIIFRNFHDKLIKMVEDKTPMNSKATKTIITAASNHFRLLAKFVRDYSN